MNRRGFFTALAAAAIAPQLPRLPVSDLTINGLRVGDIISLELMLQVPGGASDTFYAASQTMRLVVPRAVVGCAKQCFPGAVVIASELLPLGD